MLPALNWLAADDVYVLEIGTGAIQLFKFIVEQGFLYGVAAVEQYHVGVFIAVSYGFCYGAEGSNTAAAGNAYYVLCVPQGLIGEYAKGFGGGDFCAHLPVVQYVLRSKAVIHTAYGQHVVSLFQRLTGRGGKGVGAGQVHIAYIEPYGKILAGIEPCKGLGVFLGISLKIEGLGKVIFVHYFGHLKVLYLGV